jgi:16S rRNA (guanine527-N7)-methyltransferase
MPSIQEKFSIYAALLRKWQKAVNLVSPKTLDDLETRHLADSAQIADLLPSLTPTLSLKGEGEFTLFDLGSGAGFPGLVLAMLRPDITVHLVESDQKKCEFLRTVSRETHTPVLIHMCRIESLITESVPDVITARALSSLAELLGYCLPWAEKNPSLVMIFPKGEKADEEIAEARKHYSFDIAKTPSKTDKNATILRISNLKKSLS